MPKQDQSQNSTSIPRDKLLADLEQLAKSLTKFTRLGLLMATFAVLIPFCVSYFLEWRNASWLLAAVSIILLIFSSIFFLRKVQEQAQLRMILAIVPTVDDQELSKIVLALLREL
jgi:hypothetical protein